MTKVKHSEFESFGEIIDDYKKLYDIIKKNNLNNKDSDFIKFGLKIVSTDLEELYHNDIQSGNGFEIDTGVNYNTKTLIDIGNMIDSYGIYSYLYGPRDDDPKSVELKRFQCACGKTKSEHSGIICPTCNGETKLVEKIRGWIKLPYKIFNPWFFDIFERHIRKIENKDKDNLKSGKKLIDIIKDNLKSFRSGNEYNLLTLQDPKVLERFIREYIREESVDDFISIIDTAMTSCIPVISKNFRHYNLSNKLDGTVHMQTHPINRNYIAISNSANYLQSSNQYTSKKDILKKLHDISEEWIDIKEKIYLELLTDKKSFIRSILFGGRIGNSGRILVSGLLSNYRLDVFTIGYKTFGEITMSLFRDLYLKHGTSPSSFSRMANNCPIEEDKVIMDKVLADMQANNWAYFLIYRAPNIYFGSQGCYKCIGLHDEDVIRVNDITLDANMKGDKDGDQLGIFALDRSVALNLFFSLNPYRISFNPVENIASPKHELFEGGYMTVYLALKNNRKTRVFLNNKEI